MSRTRWLGAMLSVSLVGCGDKDPPPNPPLPVTTVQVGNSDGGANETRYSGSINADASVDVAFKVSGVVDAVTRVRGADGRLVAEGQGRYLGAGPSDKAELKAKYGVAAGVGGE